MSQAGQKAAQRRRTPPETKDAGLRLPGEALVRDGEANAVCEVSTTLLNTERLIAPAGGQAGAARPNGRAGHWKGTGLCAAFCEIN